MSGKQTSEKLRTLREKRELTMRTVAKLLGISYSSMSKYEYGIRVPRDPVKQKFAEFYGVSVEWLFFDRE